ncbi:MAG: DUF2891 domain-containing protein [Chitinophagaceae bacterium]|nr:DUF2891 domain-containing protein [Chitinophagaceae bacterium]
MKRKIFFVLTGLMLTGLFSQAQLQQTTREKGQLALTIAGASHFARLPLRCIEKELPYKTGITFSDSSLITAPRNYHPVFYGCFDWHSSVHGHWMLARLMRSFPGLPETKQIREIFDRHFTEANIKKEIQLFRTKDNKSFERTYGWAWLLQLQDELLGWNDEGAKRWSQAIQPLADELSKLTVDYLNKIVYPIRVGEHSNLAFGLSLMFDYAEHRKDDKLSAAIRVAAGRFYGKDKNCPFGWEPGGSDFLSPCLEEADLMRKVLPPAQFMGWLKKFMPQLFDPTLKIEPGKVKDRTDGKLVHLDGLNLSRAWCLKGIAAVTGNKHLLQLANEHLEAALPQVASGDYAGEHWLASFAVYALTSK